VDIFYEMHYQQSYKSHEPPRLSAPESSVAFFENNPSTSFDTGEHLFVVNCSMCHGLDAKGAGPVLVTLMSTYGYETAVTPDLTTMQEGTIEPLLSVNVRPFGEHTVMPAFGKLLSPEERKAISAYIHALPK
jgi:mono/diheme cytochrome c family protein